MKKFTWQNILASGFGSGYVPIAPGTAGTVTAMFFYFIIGAVLEKLWPGSTGLFFLIAAIVSFIPGVYVSHWGEKKSGQDDPGFIVWDEITGYFVTIALLPYTWQTALVGFVFFRAMDILKPCPAYASQKLKNGWGVMVDDVIAGIYANTLTRLALLFMISFV